MHNPGSVPIDLQQWNLNVWTKRRREDKARLILDRPYDVLCLQELDRDTYDYLSATIPGRSLFGLDLQPRPGDRAYGSAIFVSKRHDWLDGGVIPGIPWLERGVWAEIAVEGQRLVVGSFHAPNAAGQGRSVKMAAYAAVTDWLIARSGPTVLAMDANSFWDHLPEDDQPALDRRQRRDPAGHWAEDLRLLGPTRSHDLRDAWLDLLTADSTETERTRRLRPSGPTAVTWSCAPHGQLTGRRYDLVFVSPELQVVSLDHRYAEALSAGSDHALVSATLALTVRTLVPNGDAR